MGKKQIIAVRKATVEQTYNWKEILKGVRSSMVKCIIQTLYPKLKRTQITETPVASTDEIKKGFESMKKKSSWGGRD